jgi:hypothetical protein
MPPTGVAGEPDLLRTVREANRAAIQSIRELYCRVTVASTPALQSDVARCGEFWITRTAFRSRMGGPHGSVIDTLVRGSRCTVIADGPKQQYVGISAVDGVWETCEVLHTALLTHADPKGRLFTFDELVQGRCEVLRVQRVNEGGQELIFVELLHAMNRIKLWFDPRVNYLVRKRVASPSPRQLETIRADPKARGEVEVVRFAEVAPAVYFPEEVQERAYKGDRCDHTAVVTFSDLRVNQPFPPDALRQHFRPGTVVSDSILMKKYPADEFGNRNGPARPLDLSPPGPVHSLDVPLLPSGKKEPRSLALWIILASLAVLMLGAALWYVRRRRAARPDWHGTAV